MTEFPNEGGGSNGQRGGPGSVWNRQGEVVREEKLRKAWGRDEKEPRGGFHPDA